MYNTGAFAYAGLGFLLLGIFASLLIVFKDLKRKPDNLPRAIMISSLLASGVIAFAIKLLVAEYLEYDINKNMKNYIITNANAKKPILNTNIINTNDKNILKPKWQALNGNEIILSNQQIEIAKLGEKLFFDTRLSTDGKIACVSCHSLNGGGTDNRPTSLGVFKQTGTRSAPSVYNASLQSLLFWDGRAKSLKQQAAGPLMNPVEMGNHDFASILKTITNSDDYKREFPQYFSSHRDINSDDVLDAITTYEQTLIDKDTPYDRYILGDLSSLSPSQIRGMKRFDEIGCKNCHDGPNFSRASKLSLYQGKDGMRIFPVFTSDLSRKYNLEKDKGANPNGKYGQFRIPSLRNIALTYPYFHNGAVTKLEDAIGVMAVSQLGMNYDNISPDCTFQKIKCASGKKLSQQDVNDIANFLRSLSHEKPKT